MSNGCICCTIREDLREALQLLAAKKRKGLLDFDRVVIETTGLADPGPVAQTFFMDDEIAESYLLDSILTLVDAKHAAAAAQRPAGGAPPGRLRRPDLHQQDRPGRRGRNRGPDPPPEAHEPARAAAEAVHFGEVPLKEVFDLRGFNLNAKLDIDPDFLKEDAGRSRPRPRPRARRALRPSLARARGHDRRTTITTTTTSRASSSGPTAPSIRPGWRTSWAPIVNIYGPRMLRYKGVLHMKGTDRKVIFQGVHQLMGSDLGPAWGEGEQRNSKMVFIGIDLPQGYLSPGARAVPAELLELG